MNRRVTGSLLATALLIALIPGAAVAGGLGRRYQVGIQTEGLAPLTGAFYEVWVVFGERKLSAGGFNVDAEGGLVDGFGHEAVFTVPRDPAGADAMW